MIKLQDRMAYSLLVMDDRGALSPNEAAQRVPSPPLPSPHSPLMACVVHFIRGVLLDLGKRAKNM